MNHALVNQLLEHAEPLVTLSASHLTPATREKLASDDMSVNAYPTAHGGLVYVGKPPYTVPLESDMAFIFEMASLAKVVWLQFDRDAVELEGLPVFRDDVPDC